MGIFKLNVIDYMGGGGGGSSTLADLSDVDLSTLADGEVLTYDATEGKWVNAELDIEANPADTPTQTLTSLKINGVTYSLPSGGGEVVRASNTITISGGVS